MTNREVTRIVDGFELGISNHWTTTNAAIPSGTRRTGAYSLKLTAAGAGAIRASRSHTAGGEPGGRCYILLEQRPNQNLDIVGYGQGAGATMYTGVSYNAATGALRGYVYDGTYAYGTDGFQPDLDTWYRIEWRAIQPSGSQERVEWYINGTVQPEYTRSGLGVHSTPGVTILGDLNNAGVATQGIIYYDDLLVLTTTGQASGWLPDWPWGGGKGVVLRPNAEGTHSVP